MTQTHLLLPAIQSIEEEVQKTRATPINRTRATLIYGPYPHRDDPTRDNFYVSILDPETGRHEESRWVDSFEALTRLLPDRLQPAP